MSETPGLFKKIQFFYCNYVEDLVTKITANSENAQFPLSNLKNSKSTKVFRTITGTNNAEILFDFITANPVNAIFIRPHFRYGFGFAGTLTIKGNSFNSDWNTPEFETTITPNHEHGIGWHILDAPVSYRFWRVEGAGGNYFELADIFIGKGFESIRNISRNFKYKEIDLSTVTDNEYGQIFVDKRNIQKEISGRINLIPKDSVKQYLDFFKAAGVSKSFFVILDECGCVVPEPERYAGRFFFKKKPDTSHVFKGMYNSDSFTCREQP